MIGALLGKLVGNAVKKGSAKAVSKAAKVTAKGASKAGNAVKKRIGSIASKAISGAGIAGLATALSRGGAATPTPEEQSTQTSQPQADFTQDGGGDTGQSIIPSSDPLISLIGLNQAISNVVPIFDQNLAPLKSDESKTAVVIRKNVVLENILNDDGENVSVLKAGTYIETRIDQIANLFRITDALRSSIGILDVGLSDVAKQLKNIDDSVEEVREQNRQTLLKNERRRDEEQTEKEEEKKPSKLKETLADAGEFVKAGLLVGLANYSKALVAGTVLTAMNAFGDEVESDDEDEESVLSQTDMQEFTALDAALGIGGVTAAAVVAKKVIGKKAVEEGAEVAARTVATQGAESAARTVATQGSESAARTIGTEASQSASKFLGQTVAKDAVEKAIPPIAKKTIAKTLGKAVPGISWLVGGALAVYEISRGNYAGAALEAAGSVGGLATAIPAMVGVIANEVYRAVYGDWPLNHSADIVAERMVVIKELTSQYVAKYLESKKEPVKEESVIRGKDELKTRVMTNEGFKELTKDEIQKGIQEGTIKRSIGRSAQREITLMERKRNEGQSDEQNVKLTAQVEPKPSENVMGNKETTSSPEDELKTRVMTNEGFKELTKDEIQEGIKNGTIKRSLGRSAQREITLMERRRIEEQRSVQNDYELPVQVVPSTEVNNQKIAEIATEVVDEKITQIIPVFMGERKSKAVTSTSSVAGTGFPSSAHDSTPSYRTRDSFVDVQYYS